MSNDNEGKGDSDTIVIAILIAAGGIVALVALSILFSMMLEAAKTLGYIG